MDARYPHWLEPNEIRKLRTYATGILSVLTTAEHRVDCEHCLTISEWNFLKTRARDTEALVTAIDKRWD